MAKGEPNPIDVKVGGRLRMLRLAKGMSQTDLGAEIGVAYQQVQKYEKGTNRIAISRLVEIARVFNVSVMDFLVHVEGINIGEAEADPLSAEILALRCTPTGERVLSFLVKLRPEAVAALQPILLLLARDVE